MKKLQIITLSLLGFMLMNLLVVSCGQKNDPSSTSRVQAPQPLPQIQAEKTLKIKDLSMGMDKKNARRALNKLGFETLWTDDARSVGLFTGPVTTDRATTNGGNLVLVYNSDDKLIHVEMWGGMVDYLFNVADLNLKEFAETFVKEYQIDEMKPFERGNIAGWKYRDEENGIELVIYTGSFGGKRITFHSVPKAVQRKFD